jgi:hypothetical protein
MRRNKTMRQTSPKRGLCGLRSETRFEKGDLTMKKSWMCVAMLAVAVALVLGAGTATAGLVAYYRLDGNATAAVGTNGVMRGTGDGPTAAQDRFGNASGALQFNGTDHFVDVGTMDDDFTNAITVSAWVRLNNLTRDHAIGSNIKSPNPPDEDYRQFQVW